MQHNVRTAIARLTVQHNTATINPCSVDSPEANRRLNVRQRVSSSLHVSVSGEEVVENTQSRLQVTVHDVWEEKTTIML